MIEFTTEHSIIRETGTESVGHFMKLYIPLKTSAIPADLERKYYMYLSCIDQTAYNVDLLVDYKLKTNKKLEQGMLNGVPLSFEYGGQLHKVEYFVEDTIKITDTLIIIFKVYITDKNNKQDLFSVQLIRL